MLNLLLSCLWLADHSLSHNNITYQASLLLYMSRVVIYLIALQYKQNLFASKQQGLNYLTRIIQDMEAPEQEDAQNGQQNEVNTSTSQIPQPNTQVPIATPSKADVERAFKAEITQIPKKGPVIESNKNRLEKLISDSNKRRTRYQKDNLQSSGLQHRTDGRATAQVAKTNQTQESIGGPEEGSVNMVGSEMCEEDIEQQFNEIAQKYSSITNSKASKDALFNKTVNLSSSRKSAMPSNSTGPLNLNSHDRARKKEATGPTQVATAAQRMSHQKLRSEKVSQMTPGVDMAQKVAKAKINTNLRSSSSSGQMLRGRTKSPLQKAKQQSKVKLVLTEEERLQDELSKRMNDHQERAKVQNHVQGRYQEIESIFQANLDAGSPGRGAILNGDISEIEHINDNSTFGKQSVMTYSKPPTSSNKKPIKKAAPFSFATEVRSTFRNASKSSLNSGRPSVQAIIGGKPTIPQQTIDLVDKPAKVSSIKASSIQRSAGRKPTEQKTIPTEKDDLHDQSNITSQSKPSRLGQRNQANRLSQPQPPKMAAVKKSEPSIQRDKSKSPMRAAIVKKVQESIEVYQKAPIPRQSNPQRPEKMPTQKLNSNSISEPRRMSNSSTPSSKQQDGQPHLNLKSDDGRSTSELVLDGEQSSSPTKDGLTKTSFKNNQSNSHKSEIMNLDIEQVWKEMEEIGRSKQAAHQLFQAFQDKYYDQSDPVFFDAEQVSPTKRLISMKNATTKHHVIEYRKGITGKYAIQYTTCPEKSYVILPDDGQTDYDTYKDKNAHQFVEKIINGTVERVELEERGKKKKSNPNSRVVTKTSPVRINRDHCQRGDMIGSFNLNMNQENPIDLATEEEVMIVETEQDKPDIQITNEAQARQEDSLHESIINICSTGKNSHGQSIIVVEEKVDVISTSEVQVEQSSSLQDEEHESSIIQQTHEIFDHPAQDQEGSIEVEAVQPPQNEEEESRNIASDDNQIEEVSAPTLEPEQPEEVKVEEEDAEDQPEQEKGEQESKEEEKKDTTPKSSKPSGRRKNKGRKRF